MSACRRSRGRTKSGSNSPVQHEDDDDDDVALTTTTHWLPNGDAAAATTADDALPFCLDCLCIGTGRFLRAVLVPALVQAGLHPVLVQPRGRSFVEYMLERSQRSSNSSTTSTNSHTNDSNSSHTYPVDTVLPSGVIQTDQVPCWGAFSWGLPRDKQAFATWLHQQQQQQQQQSRTTTTTAPPTAWTRLVIGVGVTEAGLASPDTTVMRDLYHLLHTLVRHQQHQQQPPTATTTTSTSICVINTDNVPNNGTVLRHHMLTLAGRQEDETNKNEMMACLLSNHHHNHNHNNNSTTIVFLNSMVDRITSSRPGSNGMIPRAEPLPHKALVLLLPVEPSQPQPPDEEQEVYTTNTQQILLPRAFYDTAADYHNNTALSLSSQPRRRRRLNGVVVYTQAIQLETDIMLKLRIANGTHTAVAQALALVPYPTTTVLAATTTTTTADATMTTTIRDQRTASVVMHYLDALVEHQIQPAAVAALGRAKQNTTTVTGGTVDYNNNNNSHNNDTTTTIVREVYQDWRQRLVQAHFGISTFFITQNAAQKAGIRLGPTVQDLFLLRVEELVSTTTTTTTTVQTTTTSKRQQLQPVSVAMAFALAVVLRFLTPQTPSRHDDGTASTSTTTTTTRSSPATTTTASEHPIFRGWLEHKKASTETTNEPNKDNHDDDSMAAGGDNKDAPVEYADQLHYCLPQGWYEFRCSCPVVVVDNGQVQTTAERNLSVCLRDLTSAGVQQPVAYYAVVRAYLLSSQGGNVSPPDYIGGAAADMYDLLLDDLVQAVSTLYARMIAGDGILDLLEEMKDCRGVYVDGMATSCSVLSDGVRLTTANKQSQLQKPLHYRPSPVPGESALLHRAIVCPETVESVVVSEVASVLAIDLHSHLLPPSHGVLCLWGVDELITYVSLDELACRTQFHSLCLIRFLALLACGSTTWLPSTS
jgi:hypothetical protein